jgi:DNA-directed RNA polymerase II subunit RPB2
MTHWGLICPSETPDGEKIGITKNLALLAYITNQVDHVSVQESIDAAGLVPLNRIEPTQIKGGTKVMLNGYSPP